MGNPNDRDQDRNRQQGGQSDQQKQMGQNDPTKQRQDPNKQQSQTGAGGQQHGGQRPDQESQYGNTDEDRLDRNLDNPDRR